jgi:predicted amidophosphoribosyltransferase
MCSHCDKPTTAIMGVCFDCVARGHAISGKCQECVKESRETVLRLERLPSDEIETEVG